MKKIVKPWGGEEQFVLNKKCTVKILNVKSKQKTSLQYHHKRKEFWKVLEPCKIWIANKKIKAKKGDEFIIPKKTKHRLEGLSKTGSVLEISFGEFNKKDIVRIEDDYGRR